MKRREFLKAVALPFIIPSSWLEGREMVSRELRLWSYYVPLTSYDGILDVIPDQHAWDRKVDFAALAKVTNRINGKESDGTPNQASFELVDLESADEFLRVKFWHDDNGVSTTSAHSLFMFRRYIEDLLNGRPVFVATGMFQGHFHIVMIQPKTS